jgi:hypothetical protein
MATFPARLLIKSATESGHRLESNYPTCDEHGCDDTVTSPRIFAEDLL